MNAVERLLVYTSLAPEKDEKTSEPPASWPSKGEITFRNVDFAYRDGLPLVLKDVSFHIKSGEKVSTRLNHSIAVLTSSRLVLWDGLVLVGSSFDKHLLYISDNLVQARAPSFKLSSGLCVVPDICSDHSL